MECTIHFLCAEDRETAQFLQKWLVRTKRGLHLVREFLPDFGFRSVESPADASFAKISLEKLNLMLSCMHGVEVHSWSCQLTLIILTPALLEKSLLGLNSCYQILLGVSTCGPALARLR